MVSKNFSKIIFVSIISVLFAVGVGVAYTQSIPNPGHGGDSVLVSVDGFKMTLQEAMDYGFLVEGAPAPTTSYTTAFLGAWHSADDIYVSIDGAEMTLQQAISSGLCGSGSYSHSSTIVFGHSADEILVSVGGSEMSLQDAINSGKFCTVCSSHAYSSCYGNDVYWYDSCDVREEKKQECGSSAYSGSNYCFSNDVYRDYVTRGCSGSSCTSSTSKIKQEECGANGCSEGSCVEYIEYCYTYGPEGCPPAAASGDCKTLRDQGLLNNVCSNNIAPSGWTKLNGEIGCLNLPECFVDGPNVFSCGYCYSSN